MDDAFVRAVGPVPLPNKCHLHCREMRRICLRRRKGGTAVGLVLQHHLNHQHWRAAEKPKGPGVVCVPGSSSSSHHQHPTSCVAAFAPKLRRQAFFFLFLLFLRVLIFGNAQLCLYAGQNVNAPKIDTVVYHNVFSFVCTWGLKRVTDSI